MVLLLQFYDILVINQLTLAIGERELAGKK